MHVRRVNCHLKPEVAYFVELPFELYRDARRGCRRRYQRAPALNRHKPSHIATVCRRLLKPNEHSFARPDLRRGRRRRIPYA